MARIARVVVPGYPHHVTQHGNRRQRTSFSDADYGLYFGFLARFWGSVCARETGDRIQACTLSARRAIYPERVSPAAFAFASRRASTRLGSVILTRST